MAKYPLSNDNRAWKRAISEDGVEQLNKTETINP